MKQKVREFLSSGLLEKYVKDEASTQESLVVERHIAQYPEVREEYNMFQDQLELTARAQAMDPPDILDSIMRSIDESSVIQLKPKRKLMYWVSVAACISALILAGVSYSFYNKNKSLVDENNTIAEEIFDLRSDIDENNVMLDNVMKQLMKLNNPETEKYVLRGNERAKDLKTVAYINPIEKSSLIDVIDLPKLSNEQCYQMWAQMQDKMISLGILDESDRNLKPIPYVENALSLSITIEPKGGNESASLENAVANIPLKKNNE
jgi:hypothetical protein